MPTRYESVQRLGRGGGEGATLVRDRYRGGRLVVMKRLPRAGYSPDATAAQRRQLLLLRRVRHPNVAPVLDVAFDEPEQTYVVTTEHVDGLDLVTYARDLAPESTADLVAGVLRGLAHVHGWGLVHHGLRPSNVLVAVGDEGPEPRLVDFALVPSGQLDLDAEGERAARRILYTAPELLDGKPGDARSDLYALGLVIWEILEGALPFDVEDPGRVRAWHRGERAVMRPPGPLGRLVGRLIEPLPGRRCRSAAEALRLLSADAGRVFFHDSGDQSECLLSGRFVGRDETLQRLEAVAQRVFRGDGGGLFLVEGGRGMGKTRVLEELGVLGQLAGIRVAEVSSTRSRPLAALRDLLSEVVGALGPDHEAVRGAAPAIADLLPDLVASPDDRPALTGRNEPVERSRPVDPEPWREELASFLIAAGEARPFLFLIDDLHAIDESSLDILLDLSRRLRGAPGIMVGTYDPERCDDEHPLRRWTRYSTRERLVLEPLDAAAVEELVAGAFALPGEVREISEMVVRLTGGVPLYVEALLRSLIEGEPLAVTDDGRLTCGAETDAGSSAGERATQLVVRRLARLTEDVRTVADALTVFEGAVGLDVLTVVTGLAVDRVEAAVRTLEAEDAVATDFAPEALLVRWRSELFREAVVAELDADRRRELHDRAVEHLEESGGASPSELAWHALRGSEPHRYLAHARAAVKEAMALHDEHQGRRILEGALQVARQIDDQRQVREISFELVDVLERLGDTEGAASLLRSLVDETPGDAETLARLGGFLKESGDHEEAERTLRAAHGALAGTDGSLLRSRIARGLAECLIRRGRHQEAVSCLDEALAYARDGGLARELARVHAALGLAHWFGRDRNRALEHHQESQRHYLEAKDRLGAAISHVNIGLVLWTRGRLRDAHRCFVRAEEVARRVSHYRILATALHNRGLAELELGRLQQARKTLRASLHMRGRLGDEAGAARSVVNLGLVHLRLGGYETALELFEDACERRRCSDDRAGLANVLVNIAELRLELGDRTRAKEAANEALALAGSMKDDGVLAEALIVQSWIELRCGTPDAAAAAALRARERWNSLGQVCDAAEADLVLARVDVLRGDVAAARSRIAGALATLRGSGHARLMTLARLEAGRLRGAGGVPTLRRAYAMARQSGLADLSWRCAGELGAALLVKGRRLDAATTLREGMELLRGIHDDLPPSQRGSWLQDPEKLRLKDTFADAVRALRETMG